MAALDKVLKDGTETGGTVADKINLSFDKIDANELAISNIPAPLPPQLTASELLGIQNAQNSLSATNFVVDKSLLESAVLILNDNIDNVAEDVALHNTDFQKHMGTDQNAAFDGANSPSAFNPLATMSDIPSPPPPPPNDVPVVVNTAIGVKPTASQCYQALTDGGENRVLLKKNDTTVWSVFGVQGLYYYEKLTKAN